MRTNVLFLIMILIIGICSGAYFSEVYGTNEGSKIALKGPVNPKTVYVDSNIGNDKNDGITPDKPKKSIHAGVSAVNDGGIVQVANGTYIEHMALDKNVTLNGTDKKGVIVDGLHSGQVIAVGPGTNVNIFNFTIQKGAGTDGGGIYNKGNLTVINCAFSNNHADSGEGGAIYNKGNLKVINSDFSNNRADSGEGGAIYNENYSVTVTDSNFTKNIAKEGGAIYNNCTGIFELTNSTLTQNEAKSGGAIINQIEGNLTDINNTFKDNRGVYGGALNNNGTLTDINSTFDHNVVFLPNRFDQSKLGAYGQGGAIYNGNAGHINDTNSSYIGNNASNYKYAGGAIFNAGEVIETNGKFNNNCVSTEFGNGGAIFNMKILTINNCTLTQNNAESGGGIYNQGACNINSGSIQQNNATYGGGIYNQNGNLNTGTSTIAHNSANVDGGGIFSSNMNVNKNLSTFDQNTPNDEGFGIFVQNNGNDNNDGSTPDQSKKTIQNAIDTVPQNFRIIAAGGTYTENLHITKNIELKTYDNFTSIDGRWLDHCIYVGENVKVRIEGFTIMKGLSSYGGGGVYNEGNLTLIGCKLHNNHAADGQKGKDAKEGSEKATNGDNGASGGGIYNTGSITLINSFISENTAGNGGNGGIPHIGLSETSNGGHGGHGGSGGGIYNSGSLTLIESYLQNNAAGNGGFGGRGAEGYASPRDHHIIISGIGGQGGFGGNGGGIYSSGHININDSDIGKNTAGSGGIGGAGGDGYSPDCSGGDGSRGGRGGFGGGIYCKSENNIIANSQLCNNVAGNGGSGGYGGDGHWGIWDSNGGSGGDGMSAGSGGAICISGSLTLTDSKLWNNLGGTGGNGGNVGHIGGGIPTAKKDIYGGMGGLGGVGGAISCEAELNVERTDFTNNSAACGGAIFKFSDHSLKISDSELKDNSALNCTNGVRKPSIIIDKGPDGINVVTAIFGLVRSVYALTKSDFSAIKDGIANVNSLINEFDVQSHIDNTTNPVEATGGAIYINNGPSDVVNCTFYNDSAVCGGAIHNFGACYLNVTNSTLKNNSAGLGGSIYNNNIGSLNVTRNLFESNAAMCGGAIFFGGNASHDWAYCNIKENIFRNDNAYVGNLLYCGVDGKSKTYVNFNQIAELQNLTIYNVYNDSNIDASHNYWGSNDGPTIYDGKISWNIGFEPYVVLKAYSDPSNVQYGSNSTIKLDLLHDNKGNLCTGGHVPSDNLKLKFEGDDSCNSSFIPSEVYLKDGKAVTTYNPGNTLPSITSIRTYVTGFNAVTELMINITKIPTYNLLNIPLNATVGNPVKISTHVSYNKDYVPCDVTNGTVYFYIDGVLVGNGTVEDGWASFIYNTPSDFTPGRHEVSADYSGTLIYSDTVKSGVIDVNK